MKTSNIIILTTFLLIAGVVFYVPMAIIGNVNKSIAESGYFNYSGVSSAYARTYISDSTNINNKIIGKGSETSKLISIAKGFSHLKVSGVARIEISQKEKISVELSDYENLISLSEIFVNSDTLFVKLKDGANIENYKTTVKISLPELKSIECVNTKNLIKGFGNLQFDTLVIKNNGQTGFMMRGKVNYLYFSGSGNSELRTGKLICKNAKIEIEKNGYVETCVLDTLNANISGSGNIGYFGEPKKINQTLAGYSNIYHLPFNK